MFPEAADGKATPERCGTYVMRSVLEFLHDGLRVTLQRTGDDHETSECQILFDVAALQVPDLWLDENENHIITSDGHLPILYYLRSSIKSGRTAQKHSAAWSCLCATNEVAGRHYYSEMSTKQQVQRENRVQKVRFFKELQRSKLSILFHSLQMNAGTQFSYSHLIPGSTIPQAIAVLEPSSAVTSDNRQTFEQQHLLNNNTTCLCVLQSPRARKIVVLPQTGVTHASDTTYLLG